MKTDYLITAFVVAMACAIPAGLILQYIYPASSWWVLSVGALIIFMAG
jgi:hypothetical protein